MTPIEASTTGHRLLDFAFKALSVPHKLDLRQSVKKVLKNFSEKFEFGKSITFWCYMIRCTENAKNSRLF